MYPFHEIEPHWQNVWEDQHVWSVSEDASKPKYYVLDMFPYPSGSGLHVGHVKGYTATDIVARYKRMRGFNVLHPIGWDAFGSPAEKYAIKTGTHPRARTQVCIDNFRGQLKRLGLSYDWEREINTSEPDYYRWTQWIFAKLYNSWFDGTKARPIDELPEVERDSRRLAYRAKYPVWYSPSENRVLTKEEAETQNDAIQVDLNQWVLRITDYRDRLVQGLDGLDWPEEIKESQRNWIAQMRDWVFSRQRYWGEPFPLIYDREGKAQAVDQLVELPNLENIQPSGLDSPLSSLTSWVELPDGSRRETHTMPQWAGSCWYYLRYCDPHNDKVPWSSSAEKYWMPVDLYVGGREHATSHLLYSRFWHMVLYDLGYVSTPEPFAKLINQGLVLALNSEGRTEKMSKSKGNVVNPDDIIKQVGADTLRIYEMFIGPLSASSPWNTEDLAGSQRFLRKVYRRIQEGIQKGFDDKSDPHIDDLIRDVTQKIESFSFNTAISSMMAYLNKSNTFSWESAEAFVKLLFPFAPHLAQELWAQIGHVSLLDHEPWPSPSEKNRAEAWTIVVQVNGKKKGTIEVSADAGQEEITAKATDQFSIVDPKRVIYVPGKLLSFVV